MLKPLLAGCSLVALLAVGSLPARSQATAPATPIAPATPAPAPSADSITPQERQKFALAVKDMLVIIKSTEAQMLQVVQATKLPEPRFNEIYISRKNPNTKPSKPITPEEQQKYDQAMAELARIRSDAQAKMDAAAEVQGINRERFKQIFAAVQENPKLRQEIQQMIQMK